MEPKGYTFEITLYLACFLVLALFALYHGAVLGSNFLTALLVFGLPLVITEAASHRRRLKKKLGELEERIARLEGKEEHP